MAERKGSKGLISRSALAYSGNTNFRIIIFIAREAEC